jgi:phage terminase small subunit
MTKKRTPKKSLTAKQRKFFLEFPKDMNATQAAIRAGYSKKVARVQGCKLVKMVRRYAREKDNTPNNKSAAKSAHVPVSDTLTEDTEQDYQRFLVRLNQLAYGDVRKLFDQHNNAIDIPDLSDDVAPLIAGFEITEEFEGRGAERKSVGYTKKFKMVDPLAAILALGKVRGFYSEKVEHTGKNGGPIHHHLTVEFVE